MTKLQIAKTLLPLVVKAQIKGHHISFGINAQNMSFTHFKKDTFGLNIDIWMCEPDTHEAKFNKILTYLKTL